MSRDDLVIELADVADELRAARALRSGKRLAAAYKRLEKLAAAANEKLYGR